MAFRFTGRSLRYRFILNSVSQWQVFACLTVMMGFARRNDAASSNVRIRMIFIPTHILFLALLIWGLCNDHVANCTARTYPKIFTYQYGLFLLTYVGFMFLHHKNFFMDWHESIRDIDWRSVD